MSKTLLLLTLAVSVSLFADEANPTTAPAKITPRLAAARSSIPAPSENKVEKDPYDGKLKATQDQTLLIKNAQIDNTAAIANLESIKSSEIKNAEKIVTDSQKALDDIVRKVQSEMGCNVPPPSPGQAPALVLRNTSDRKGFFCDPPPPPDEKKEKK